MDYPQCDICNKIFKNPSALKVHQANMHQNFNSSVARLCSICQKQFKNISAYNNHIKRHTNYMQCTFCNYLTTDPDDINLHTEGHKPGMMFCCQCSAFVKSDSNHSHENDESSEVGECSNECEAAATNYPTGGLLELSLPSATLDACQQLSTGQILQMTGTSSNTTKPSITSKEDVCLYAVRKDTHLSLILRAATMGSVFQEKLSQCWQCIFTSCNLIKTDNCSVKDITMIDPNALTCLNPKQTTLCGEQRLGDKQQCEISSEGQVANRSGQTFKHEEHQENQQLNISAESTESKDKSTDRISLQGVQNADKDVTCNEAFTKVCMSNERKQENDSTVRNTKQEAVFSSVANSNGRSKSDERDDKYDNNGIKNQDSIVQEGCNSEGGSNMLYSNDEEYIPSGATSPEKVSQSCGLTEGGAGGGRQLRKLTQGTLKHRRNVEQCEQATVKKVKRHKGVSVSEAKKITRRKSTRRTMAAKRNAAVSSENAESQTDSDDDFGEGEYMSAGNMDRKLKDEVLELNGIIISEMISAGDEGTEKLKDKDTSEELICVMCMKAFRRQRWYFFCRHLDEIHFMTAANYRNLLLLDSSTERQESIKHYKEQQLQKMKHYKEVKYKVKEDQLIQCPGCMTILSAFGALCAHIRSVHMDDSNYMDLVKYAEELREKRMRTSDKQGNTQAVMLTCDYCGVQKVGMNGIKVHIRMAHPNEKDLKEKLKNYREFVKEVNLKLRRRQYHEDVKNKPKGVLCRFCGEKYSFRSSRGRHEKYSCEYNPNRIKTFTCQYCDHRFFSKDELTIHRKQHVEEDFKYVCDICGVVRRTKAGMYDHKKNKHGTTPPKHKCPHCEKKFHNKDRLNTHMTVHSDIRPYQCEICGSSFKTRASVVKHQNAMHYNKYTYYCDKCGHGVSKLAYLQAHKCGRIRRSQGRQQVAEPAVLADVPIQPVQAPQTITLPELTTLPKMDTQHLVYDEGLNKDGVVMETELSSHILMGGNLQVNGNTIQTVSMPYSIDAGQQLVDVLPHGAVSSGFNQDFNLSHVTVIEYSSSPQVVDNRAMKVQYSDTLTDQNAL